MAYRQGGSELAIVFSWFPGYRKTPGGKMKHIHHVQQSCDGVGAELEYVGGGHVEVINEGMNDIDGGVELESIPTVVTKKSSVSECISLGATETPVEMPSLWSLAVGVASLL
uniref:Uncharacterized protein n=1 Tax=Oryza meridionalis TaxID=40149 RepID=A0A0E0D782_9ORYZ